MPRWVLLKHTVPNGSWHLDLLIERSGGGVEPLPEHRLLSLRVQPQGAGPDRGCGGVPWDLFFAERMPDHRAFYLEHEGPVSGGRGVVERLGGGGGRVLVDEPGRVGFEIEAGGERVRYRGRPAGEAGCWRFDRVVDVAPGEPAW